MSILEMCVNRLAGAGQAPTADPPPLLVPATTVVVPLTPSS